MLVASTHFASFFLGPRGAERVAVRAHRLSRCTAPSAVEAAVKYLVLAGATSAFLLFGMALVYAEAGTMTARRRLQRCIAGLGAGRPWSSPSGWS